MSKCDLLDIGALHFYSSMKFKLLIILVFFSLKVFSQSDSVVVEDTYELDTIFISDTVLIIDTIISIDTVVVKTLKSNFEETDTIFLSSHQQSWSLIPEEKLLDTKQLILRKDSGMLLVSAKISFSDSSDDTDWKGYSISTLPPIALQVEYFHDDYFSYGAQLLIARNKYTNDTLPSTYFKDGVVGVACIGSFHYGSWLQDITHNWFKFGYLDLYASLALRFDIHSDIEAGVWNEDLQQFEEDVTNKDVYMKMKLRPIFGARYYISDRFSINVELGKGNLGMLSSSVSWLINP